MHDEGAMRALILLVALSSCGSSLPRAPAIAQPAGAFIEVPYPPPPARVEMVPARPETGDPRWVDGDWSWEADRWRWQDGGWFTVPPGVFYAQSKTTRADTRLFYANPAWRDRGGARVNPPPSVAGADTEGTREVKVPSEAQEAPSPSETPGAKEPGAMRGPATPGGAPAPGNGATAAPGGAKPGEQGGAKPGEQGGAGEQGQQGGGK